jgi:hypothetical protein
MLGWLDRKWKHERMIVGVGYFAIYLLGGLYAVHEPRPPYFAEVYIVISSITFALQKVQKVTFQRRIQELQAETKRLREQEVFR